MSDELKYGRQDVDDPVVQAAMRSFRGSVHAWSEAACNHPRTAVAPAALRFAWRRAVVWVLTLVLSFGLIGMAAYERHEHNIISLQHEQQREQERQRVLAEQHAREAEDLLANVDSDVSREVPAAMEPLAQLMDEQ
jgi:hypothetical protein